MAWARMRDHRRLSRALLAGATVVAAFGVLSVRLVMVLLIGERYAVVVGPGVIGWEWHQAARLPDHADRWGPFLLDRNDDSMEWWFVSESGPRAEGVVAIPLWMPLAGMVVPGVWLAIRHRRRSGCCPKCDYDLTGLEPGAPCPECGRPVPPRDAPRGQA